MKKSLPRKGYSAAILVVKLLATAIAFWLILRSIDFSASIGAIREIAPAGAALAFAFLLAQVGVSGLRWSAIAQACDIPLKAGEAAIRFWQSLFFGQFTPSGVGGDAWRIYAISERAPAIANAINSVFLDRIIGAVALVLMVLFGFAVSALRGELIDNGALVAGIGFAIVIATSVALLLVLKKMPVIASPWDRVGISAFAREISILAHEAIAKPGMLAAAMALSFVAQMLAALSVWVLARALGYDPGFGACLVVVPLALLISMIPITIAGWGLREGVIAAGFVHTGASLDVAAAISLLFGLAVATVGLTGGILLFVDKGGRVSGERGRPASTAGRPAD